jgi:histone acetyltransferase (RNA polymerase elongator complex component)
VSECEPDVIVIEPVLDAVELATLTTKLWYGWDKVILGVTTVYEPVRETIAGPGAQVVLATRVMVAP